MAGFWIKAKETVAATASKARGFFASGEDESIRPARVSGAMVAAARMAEALKVAPIAAGGVGMDDSSGQSTVKAAYGLGQPHISDALLMWFLNQGFIGHQIAGLVAQHWLIDKACSMPARDAVRQGYTIISDDGSDLDPVVLQAMKKADERYKLNKNLIEFVNKGRVFGIRVALFRVMSTDPNYYENPFNPDGVTAGSYKGIVQVDPYWCSPELDMASAADPASLHFYEPTWWRIDGKRYHRSHLVIFRNSEVSDILKPVYLYGGVPVPQRILERVYCAERTANEAPQLAMTKRTTIFATDAAEAMGNVEKFNERLNDWVSFRDNYAVKVLDKDADEMTQLDTSLTDLDAVIMSQYQIVAAAAGVPATKLLGTTPKGFNSSGDYEEASYHEELESIQTHDLTPMVERHHLLVMRSDIAPKLSMQPIPTSVNWEPLDSPTAKEYAEIGKLEAERDAVLVGVGAIDNIDVRNRLRADRDGGYHGIDEAERGDDGTEPVTVASPGMVGDSLDGVRLVSNQQYLDPAIVSAKVGARDFTVQVSPLFVDDGGRRYRIVIDGHHSLAAAKLAGVAPNITEGDYSGSDYTVLADA